MSEIKQYVNLDSSRPSELKEIKPERAGKVIRVSAKINKKHSGVPVVFEIKSGANNVYPSLDRSNFSSQELKQLNQVRSLLPGLQAPMSSKRKVLTNAEGVAEIDFTLSEFGGDEFEVKAYLYKPGGVKGKELVSEKYVVWRRIYYQVGRFKAGTIGASRNGSLPEVPNFNWQPVKDEFEARGHNIELVDDSRTDLVARHKNILETVDPYDDLNYSVNEGYEAEREPVSLRVILCNMIAEPRFEVCERSIFLEKKTIDISVKNDTLWRDDSLPIGLDCIISATIQFHENDTPRPINGIYIYGVGPSTIRIRFDLMEQSVFEASFGKTPTKARLTFKIKVLDGSINGLSWYNAVWLAHNFMHGKRPYTPEGKQTTAIHEIGHFIDMVNPQQNTWYKEHGHTGDHCSTGISKVDLIKDDYSGLNGTCVMFGEGDPLTTAVNKFCIECDPSLKISSVRNPQRIKRWP
ncbi:MAG: hypothetical protein OEY89_08185 [Gammaproteobacteria bacterium]|nr:hypothetical protein [Gammaproteobacteria bacterium]